MSVLTTVPQFLYPTLRQYPFDEVSEKIVRALEKRNWQVPGINVELDTYGSGEAKYQLVRYVTGNDFKLYFCRTQKRLDSIWSDTAALQSVYIPCQILEVYSDESTPTYYLYVGNDWEADKNWFMNSTKINAKLNKKPRKYLKYHGISPRQSHGELVANDDLNREYLPEGDEPVCINLDQKFAEFSSWLEEYVLKYILSFPEADSPSPKQEVELIPYEGPYPTIFSLCSFKDAARITKGKKCITDLPLERRHASIGYGRRLVPLFTESNTDYPKLATDGFIWCDVNQSITKTSKKAELLYSITSSTSSFYSSYLVAIKLKYSNGVYVADNSKFDETRQELFRAIAPRDTLTDAELGEAYAARGATLVPITEYKGGYKEPIVLINRELDFDEIEWISKFQK